jgi:SAM-dependent methyltransferase
MIETQKPALNVPTDAQKLSEEEICPTELLKGQEEAFARDVARLQARSAEFILEPCPACGSELCDPAFEKWTFRYVTCKKCSTLYMRPRPSPEVMHAYYSNSENYAYWAKHIFPASETARREKIHRPWFDRVAGYCRKCGIEQGVMLEVGPGFGTFSAVAKESGFFRKVIAVEPTPEMAASCRARGIEVINKRIEDMTDEVPEADLVVAFETIEHLYEPALFIKQCARFLRPGGLLVVSCPNGQGFDIAALGPVSLAIDPEHVNLFNPSSLSLLVEACGFEVLEVTTPGRLDAEFVRTAVQAKQFDLKDQPFLQRVLIDEWDRLGWPFQQFLAQNGLSSHMWLAARKK